MTITGCSKTADQTSNTDPTSAQTTEQQKFTFNTRPRTSFLDEVVRDEDWEALYSFCDAVRAGDDTFECKDKNAYDFATDESIHGPFFPAACTFVAGDGFDNRTGKIKYKKDKAELAERISKFEQGITDVINEYVKADYTDFEKCLALYEYVTLNFTYNDGNATSVDGKTIDEFGCYACLTNKTGICNELATAYSFLQTVDHDKKTLVYLHDGEEVEFAW